MFITIGVCLAHTPIFRSLAICVMRCYHRHCVMTSLSSMSYAMSCLNYGSCSMTNLSYGSCSTMSQSYDKSLTTKSLSYGMSSMMSCCPMSALKRWSLPKSSLYHRLNCSMICSMCHPGGSYCYVQRWWWLSHCYCCCVCHHRELW